MFIGDILSRITMQFDSAAWRWVFPFVVASLLSLAYLPNGMAADSGPSAEQNQNLAVVQQEFSDRISAALSDATAQRELTCQQLGRLSRQAATLARDAQREVANIPVHNWSEVRGVADSDFVHELEGAAGQLASLERDFSALQLNLEQQESRAASCRSEDDASLLLDATPVLHSSASGLQAQLRPLEQLLASVRTAALIDGAREAIEIGMRAKSNISRLAGGMPPIDEFERLASRYRDLDGDIEAQASALEQQLRSLEYAAESTLPVLSQQLRELRARGSCDVDHWRTLLQDSRIAITDAVLEAERRMPIAIEEMRSTLAALSADRRQSIGERLLSLQQSAVGAHQRIAKLRDMAISCRDRAKTASLVTVPDMRGMELAKAQSMLAFIGLSTPPHPDLGSPAVPPEQMPGIVQSSSPAAGSQLTPGSPVRLIVYGAPPAPVVPSVHGLDEGAARGMLASAGFSPADTTIGTEAPHEELAGKVQTTSPGPGTPAEAGAPVMLIVYAGRPALTEEQTAGDCSRFPGATAQYDHQEGKVICRCPDGSIASSITGGCPSSTTADTAHDGGPKASLGKLEIDCSLYPGSRPVFIPSLGVVCQCQDGSFPMSSGRCKQLPVPDSERSAASAVTGAMEGRLPAGTRLGDYGEWPGQTTRQNPVLVEQMRRRQEALARQQKLEGWLANTNRLLGHIVEMQRGRPPSIQTTPAAPTIPRQSWPPQIPQGSGGFPYPGYTPMQDAKGRQPTTKQTAPASPATGSRADSPVMPGIGPMMGQTAEESNETWLDPRP